MASGTCRRKAFFLNSIIRKATSLMLLPVHPGRPILCLCLPHSTPSSSASSISSPPSTSTSLRPVLPVGNAWLNTGASAFVPRQSKVFIKAADGKEVDLQELRKQQAQAGAPIALPSPASPRCSIERLKKEEKCKKKEEEAEEKERKERKEQERKEQERKKRQEEVKEEEERQGGR
ncbi:hypothetical protein GLOTRDRAFT_137382 [Gloeophyllum trabeum ATCC 11539]|uniref:Uncharacterized protein n=2 Tax=Gloeophyllum trabeum (strain ATCC 11539 / FP-39264 / Madison 617) TaxID=670483 RepID=S7QC16_GLOTA|nr:uncharacterized protein GLOTRDRAFT_137382 [Gloeophyllum trabeum ATCC 11539]EPQ56898.1 hypothetical protein GLOTRDRAFT_137382 [Gloeophyllum trabeum ATCC 11539]